jgi:hypothetical protein
MEAYFESHAINTNLDWLKLAYFFLRYHTLEWWMAQKDAEPNLLGNLPWNMFKAKLNEKFTPQDEILKYGQELFNLHQSNGPRVMGTYVQTFTSLLSLVLMKKEYAQKVASSMACNLGLAMPFCKGMKSLATCQKMMKVVECMHDSMHKRQKRHKPHNAYLTTRVSIGIAV